MYFVAVYSQAIFHPNLSSRLSRRMATLTDKEAMRETVRGQILKRLLSMEGNDNLKHRERNLKTCSFYFEDESLEEGFCTRYLDSGSLEPCLMLTCASVSGRAGSRVLSTCTRAAAGSWPAGGAGGWRADPRAGRLKHITAKTATNRSELVPFQTSCL